MSDQPKETAMVTGLMKLEIFDESQRVLASFHEEAATLQDPRTRVTRVGRSCTHPFTYYLFSNGRLIGILDVQGAIHAALDCFPVEPPTDEQAE